MPFGFGLLWFQSGSPSSNRQTQSCHLEKQELQGKSASLSHTNPFKSFQAHPLPVLMSCCVTPRGYNTLQHGGRTSCSPGKAPGSRQREGAAQPVGHSKAAEAAVPLCLVILLRFIFRSYQQFTVGCSLLSKIHPSIFRYGHIPAYSEVTVQLC